MHIGKPKSSTSEATSAAPTSPLDPSTMVKPRPATVALATALSPIVSICSAVGPTNRMLADATASANSSLSDRNPYPGWTIVHPLI